MFRWQRISFESNNEIKVGLNCCFRSWRKRSDSENVQCAWRWMQLWCWLAGSHGFWTQSFDSSGSARRAAHSGVLTYIMPKDCRRMFCSMCPTCQHICIDSSSFIRYETTGVYLISWDILTWEKEGQYISFANFSATRWTLRSRLVLCNSTTVWRSNGAGTRRSTQVSPGCFLSDERWKR